jgi:hypothetical protein
MDHCECCEDELGVTKFFAVVKGSGMTLCRTCFFEHINGGTKGKVARTSGDLNYEVLSRVFLLD